MKMRKLCMLMSMALGLVACDSSQNKDVSKIPPAQIGAVISNIDTNPFLHGIYTNMQKTAAENPQISLQLDVARDSQDTENAQLEAMLNGGAKALIVLLVDPKIGTEFAAKMCDRRVPVVYINRSPGAKALQECDIAYYVGPDDRFGGTLQAQVALEKWQEHSEWDKNGDGKIQLAVLEGTPGTPSTRQRADWALAGLKFHPEGGLGSDGLDILIQEHAKYDEKVAKELVETKWLKMPEFDKVEMILAGNDNMALGAATAIEEAGKKVPIFAINATPEGLAGVKAGRLQGTVFNDNISMAQISIRMAANLANERPPMEGIYLDMDESGAVLIPMKRTENMPQ